MKQPQDNLLTVFRRISDALDLLSNEELQRLSDPSYTVEVRAVRRRAKEEQSTAISEDVAKEFVKVLTGQSSRQDAQALLDAQFPSKKALEFVARHLDIPIVRQDKLEDLRDKIVEATVGARIRSQAIQGTGG